MKFVGYFFKLIYYAKLSPESGNNCFAGRDLNGRGSREKELQFSALDFCIRYIHNIFTRMNKFKV
jgi:hypothetical protein